MTSPTDEETDEDASRTSDAGIDRLAAHLEEATSQVIAFVTGLAEGSDDTSLREVRQAPLNPATAEIVLDNEAAFFNWEEQMRETLEGLLGASG